MVHQPDSRNGGEYGFLNIIPMLKTFILLRDAAIQVNKLTNA